MLFGLEAASDDRQVDRAIGTFVSEIGAPFEGTARGLKIVVFEVREPDTFEGLRLIRIEFQGIFEKWATGVSMRELSSRSPAEYCDLAIVVALKRLGASSLVRFLRLVRVRS